VRVLLVEDDAMLGDAVRRALADASFSVDWLRDGRHVQAALDAASYDVLLLDLGLPGRDGLDVLRSLRAARSHLPVIVLTARDAVRDRIAGLDAGADDYLVKPFDTDELLARIRALLRREAGRGAPVYTRNGVTLNSSTREATVDGRPVALSSREWAVLEPMVTRPGAVFSRRQLEEKLYGWKEDISSNAVEVYVHGLRRKLGADVVRTVRGLGYVVPRE
jgi:DNA-binding response OmpR family regulator